MEEFLTHSLDVLGIFQQNSSSVYTPAHRKFSWDLTNFDGEKKRLSSGTTFMAEMVQEKNKNKTTEQQID